MAPGLLDKIALSGISLSKSLERGGGNWSGLVGLEKERSRDAG